MPELYSALVLSSLLCLLMALGTCSIVNREAPPRSSVAFCAGFILLGVSIPLQAVPEGIVARVPVVLLHNIGSMAGLGAILVGIRLRCAMSPGYTLLTSIFAPWLVAFLVCVLLFDRPLGRLAASTAALVAVAIAAMHALLAHKSRRNLADALLVAMLALCCLGELLLLAFSFARQFDMLQVWSIRATMLPLMIVGVGVFVLQSYALDSIDDLNRRSETDALTELLNRRGFDDRLMRAIASATRYGRSLSLVMADLDHFKRVNDNFGHAAGDSVLRAFAELLRDESREVDTVARIGGEEFAIIVPEVDADHAQGYAERLRTETERRISINGQVVTASFGVADARGEECDAHSLIDRADSALYTAKSRGRNRVYRHGD